MTLSDRIYDALPQSEGVNRYDREWKCGKRSARFYVGVRTNRRTPGFNLWLTGPRTTLHVVWPESPISYQSKYIGPEPSTFDSAGDPANWEPVKGWYLNPPCHANYHKWQWRLGYLHGFVGKLCGLCLSYFDGRMSFWFRRHKDDH